MDEIKEDVRRLKNAVFGNPDNPVGQPGVLHMTQALEVELKQVTKALTAIHGDLKKGVWMVLAAVITGLLALVVKGG